MSNREVIADERTENIESRNVRWNWVLLNFALAGDVFYRSIILHQETSAFADIFALWLGTNVLQAVLGLATGGTTFKAFKVSAVPGMIAGLVVGAMATVYFTGWDAWAVTLAAFVLALVVIIAAGIYRSRRGRR